MSAARRMVLSLLVLTSALLTVTAPVVAQQQQQQDPAALWADFNHYVLIARPELASAAGEALLDQADNSQLLQVVEASDYKDYDRTLARAARMEEVADVAKQLEERIQQARIEQSRDAERIQQDIELLDEGQRPYRNAVERLRAAGQYAVPQLLATLRDEQQAQLHPYVMSALASVGRPAVVPLSEALGQLEPVTQGQVAQVLAQIGYPQPLPYLKQVIENPDTDPTARQVAQKAFAQLANLADVNPDLTAAELYLALARSQYRSATAGEALPGYDAAEQKGILWEYGPKIGLVPVPVPGPIYGDVMAMRSAKRALALNAELDPALSQYLMANLRRENRLPQGEADPSYGAEMQSPAFYAMLAGPLRLHDVLDQALDDRDPALALDAIAALSTTAGTEALINLNAARQPLLRALSYPDRRVRFRAAEALANAKPDQPFPGSHRVVPVLAEGVRQSGTRYAMVLADDQEALNRLLASVGELGFEAFGGLSLEDAAAELSARPGVDLIVVNQDVPAISRLYRQTADDYKLAATPILAVISPGQQYALRDALGREQRVTATVLNEDDPQQIASAAEQALQAYAGSPIGDEESTQIALTALRVLREVALASNVYQIADALPALEQALADNRPQIVMDAGRVLALIPQSEAQQALAEAAFNTTSDVQVSLLNSLAESATYYGNWLERQQSDRLLELVRTTTGETANAAARAHGALALPTSNAVQLIVK